MKEVKHTVQHCTGPWGGGAWAGGAWPDPAGADDLAWGPTALPLHSESRDRSAFLPDAGFIGSRPGDKPTDLELPGPHPEVKSPRPAMFRLFRNGPIWCWGLP